MNPNVLHRYTGLEAPGPDNQQFNFNLYIKDTGNYTYLIIKLPISILNKQEHTVHMSNDRTNKHSKTDRYK